MVVISKNYGWTTEEMSYRNFSAKVTIKARS